MCNTENIWPSATEILMYKWRQQVCAHMALNVLGHITWAYHQLKAKSCRVELTPNIIFKYNMKSSKEIK